MTKFLIYIVATAILVLLGVDTFLVATGKGTPTTIVELAVGGGAILAFAAASFVRTVGGLSWPSWHRSRKVTIDDVDDKVDTVDDKVDTLDSKVDDLDSKVDSVDSKVDDINSTLDGRLGPEPDGFVAVINTTGEDGKIVKLYDLPVSDTYEDAIQAARESLQARTDEGNPVEDAKITVVPVYEV
jgi:outer membrane murein-binding lipoprotein Lpp